MPSLLAAATNTRDAGRTLPRRLAIGVALALAATSCAGAGGGKPRDTDRLLVVTTVAPITSIASSIVGDLADVEGIVPEGTNSHTYEPPPSVAALLADADIIFLNGLVLEEPIRQLATASMDGDAALVELGDAVLDDEDYIFDFSFPRREGNPNPHLWTDPTLAQRYASSVRDHMADLDPDHAEDYTANYEAFSRVVEGFDAAMREAFASIPADQRRLLTYHDAYAYFAQTYGWEVLGAIQVSDFSDPTGREVAELIEQIREEDVPAIFGSEVFPSPVLEQIGNETGARYVDSLRDDDLPGVPGDPEHSWLGLMRYDFATITEALGGDPRALTAFDPGPLPADQAVYPQ